MQSRVLPCTLYLTNCRYYELQESSNGNLVDYRPW